MNEPRDVWVCMCEMRSMQIVVMLAHGRGTRLWLYGERCQKAVAAAARALPICNCVSQRCQFPNLALLSKIKYIIECVCDQQYSCKHTTSTLIVVATKALLLPSGPAAIYVQLHISFCDFVINMFLHFYNQIMFVG